jgi:hypothetical protein
MMCYEKANNLIAVDTLNQFVREGMLENCFSSAGSPATNSPQDRRQAIMNFIIDS